MGGNSNGQEADFFISLFDKAASNENISPGAMHVNSTSLVWGGKKKKKKLLRGVFVAGTELPYEYSSLNKM